MGKGKRTSASLKDKRATVKLEASYGKAEAGGFRSYLEKRRGNRVQVLHTQWFSTEAAAKRDYNKLKRKL